MRPSRTPPPVANATSRLFAHATLSKVGVEVRYVQAGRGELICIQILVMACGRRGVFRITRRVLACDLVLPGLTVRPGRSGYLVQLAPRIEPAPATTGGLRRRGRCTSSWRDSADLPSVVTKDANTSTPHLREQGARDERWDTGRFRVPELAAATMGFGQHWGRGAGDYVSIQPQTGARAHAG